MWNPKKKKKRYKAETDPQTWKTNLRLPEGKRGGKLGVWDEHKPLLCMKQTTSKDLLCHTGHCAQHSVITYDGEGSKKE